MQELLGASEGDSFPPGGLALVVGASGGIGGAVLARLRGHHAFGAVVGLSRTGEGALDVTVEASVARAAEAVAAQGHDLRLVFDATGLLSGDGAEAEKSFSRIDPVQMQTSFAVNAIGPALLMKHFLPLLPREGKSVFATVSAKVGSIGDNHLGGWYSYRAAKAALNQLVRTAAVELKRRSPSAICVALHPGTVETKLSRPFSRAGLTVQSPAMAADRLVDVLERLTPHHSGGFFDNRGRTLPW